VQNHHDIAVHPDPLLWLIKEVDEPNVRTAFDAWSPALAGVDGEVLEGGGSIENHDRTARRFLETFREMTR
jgi:hypothetical protein